MIIDSIQTMYSEEVGSAPGSVSQVREATNTLMQSLQKGLGFRFLLSDMLQKKELSPVQEYWNIW